MHHFIALWYPTMKVHSNFPLDSNYDGKSFFEMGPSVLCNPFLLALTSSKLRQRQKLWQFFVVLKLYIIKHTLNDEVSFQFYLYPSPGASTGLLRHSAFIPYLSNIKQTALCRNQNTGLCWNHQMSNTSFANVGHPSITDVYIAEAVSVLMD